MLQRSPWFQTLACNPFYFLKFDIQSNRIFNEEIKWRMMLDFPPVGNWFVHEKCSLYDRWLEARGWRITRVSWCQPKEKWFQRTLWETFVFFVLLHTDESFPIRPATCLKKVNSFYAMQLKYRNWPVIYNWPFFILQTTVAGRDSVSALLPIKCNFEFVTYSCVSEGSERCIGGGLCRLRH